MPHFWDAQGVQRLYHLFRVGEQLQQRGGEHVAGSAHAAVQIQNTQCLASIWLMVLAM